MSTTPRTPTTTGPVEEGPLTTDPVEEGHTAGPPSTLYRLLGPDRVPALSPVPGTLGGHRRTRIYGRLDCPGAARAIARGGYVTHRVFFADEGTAVAAGYRPCAVCLRERYREWKASRAASAAPG